MKRIFMFASPVLFVLACFTVHAPAQTATDSNIVVTQAHVKLSKTFKFTAHELRRLESDPNYVLTKLGQHLATCCKQPKRVSNCIWVCCKGTRVRTCNPTILKALERLWGG